MRDIPLAAYFFGRRTMAEKLKIVYRKVEDIKPYEKNPRMNDEAVKFVKNSIQEFGFRNPLIIDDGGVIVAGHTRFKAALELGLKEVPTLSAGDLTPEQIKAFRIADNKTAERASWDNNLLKEELSDLLDDFNMTDFGFGDFELSILTEDFEPEPYDEDLVDQYNEHGEEYLAKKRVIITYTEEDSTKVAEILGLAEVEKVVYDISELK